LQTPSQKPAPRAGKGRIVGPRALIITLAAIALALGAYFMQYDVFPDGLLPPAANVSSSDINTASALRFSEFMSSNKGVYADDRGGFPDWIELVNESASPINLNGYMIAKSLTGLSAFTFPDHTLEAGGFVIVFASGSFRGEAGAAFHAPFKLKAGGDECYLLDPFGTVIQSVTLPSLPRDAVYARMEGSDLFTVSRYYTPMLPNTQAYHEALVSLVNPSDSMLRLTEIMASNRSYIPDEDDEFVDWIELHNAGNTDINLDGFCLTDDPNAPKQFRLPAVTLRAGEYMIVYASGKARLPVDGSPIHANFKINANHEVIVLTDPQGRLIDRVTIDALKPDQSLARGPDGQWAPTYVPTPGQPNTREGAAAADAAFIARMASPVLISRVMVDNPVKDNNGNAYGWVELLNRSGETVDLSRYGLSDNPKSPRKYQLPSGAAIAPGELLVVRMTGGKGSQKLPGKGNISANFKARRTGELSLVLSDPAGRILDRLPLGRQYSGVAYGREAGQGGFFYFGAASPGKADGARRYYGKAENVTSNNSGGVMCDPVLVELYAPPGVTVRYTTDCTSPTAESTEYVGPLAVSATTVLRARAYQEGLLPSDVFTLTLLYGAQHTLPVVSLVTDPDHLWSNDKGLYIKGPRATATFPFGSRNKGANFWMDWEYPANLELFAGGLTEVSQPVGFALNGQYSRSEAQKAFRLIARRRYGNNRIEAKLFPNRPFTSYQSVILRSSGQDGKYSRMRDIMQTQLAKGTTVLYQDFRPVIVYLNGQYWGHYNLRERLNKHGIAQHENWPDPDKVDLIKGNRKVLNGTIKSFTEILDYVKKHGLKDPEHLAWVDKRVDIDNYLDYIIIQMFTGNTDTGNVKFYHYRGQQSKWRWLLYDLDWGFWTLDTNSVRRYLNPGGHGVGNYFDTTLIRALMSNSEIRDRFLTRFGQRMATDLTTDHCLQLIDELHKTLKPEMKLNQQRWNRTTKSWEDHVKRLRNYARKRPELVLGYIKEHFKLKDSQMRKYFGEAMDIVAASK